MKVIIYRGTKEIGGTFLELQSRANRMLIDAGYPLFLNNKPIDDSVASLGPKALLELGVLPDIKGLYIWDSPGFDGVVISHAHIDHYGLLKFVNPSIPIYLSAGTLKLIEISKLFHLIDKIILENYDFKMFRMYEPFSIGTFRIMPYLMDHSAFDAAAFEISSFGKTILYTGDFRGHGRKGICLDRFINGATKGADILLTEGTLLGRQDEEVLTEQELEEQIVKKAKGFAGPVLFQSSSQNIDRLSSFYRVALRLGRVFVVDIYTANVLYELRQLGNKLPYPSTAYKNIRVFYPYRLTQKIFNEIGEKYAKRFSAFHISKNKLKEQEENIIMAVRPSMKWDIEITGLKNGLFLYSMWSGYRNSDYQKRFESYLIQAGFVMHQLHTSGHASIADIIKLITKLDPKKVVPIHTMVPDAFAAIADQVVLIEDGKMFNV
ncbi:MAG: MBL fold metallo-hydrolase [bacterium]